MTAPRDTLPQHGYVRISQLVGNPARGIAPMIPISRSSIWRLVKSGQFPAPIRLSARITVWRVEEVRAWLQSREMAGQGDATAGE